MDAGESADLSPVANPAHLHHTRGEVAVRRRAILPALTLFAAVANAAPVAVPAAPLAAPEQVSAQPEAHLVNGSNGYYHDFSKSQSRRKHRQWSLRTARVRGAWDVSRGRGVTVAIVDSGVGPTWELTGQVTAGTNLASKPPARVDLVDHGTAVASLIAARPGPHGITGVAPASTVLPVRIFDSYEAPSSRVVRGIRWAASHGADVLNLSLVEKDSPELRAAVRYALRRNVIVVAGAGNLRASGSPVQYPAAYPGVIAVGAVDSHLELADFSNEGSYVDVVAAGDRVIACDPFSTLSYYSGTSFSTPTVAGVVALMRSANPRLRSAQAERILRSTARDLGDPGRDRLFGSGLVDAERAVRAARALR
jgi:membrane-anchored mycosin MYCP